MKNSAANKKPALSSSKRPRPDRASASEHADQGTAHEVWLYADGACSGNPGPGGWGTILVQAGNGRRLEMSGSEAQTTNNRMEMTAVLEGLRRLRSPSRVHVVTDSRYLVDGMKSWVHTWQRNGWKTASKDPVKNRELWEELLRLSREHTVDFSWIRGHAGHAENERCDALAVAAYRKYQKP